MGYFHFQFKRSTDHDTLAVAHYSYIMREGRHRIKNTIHEFVLNESFNIPNWAETPRDFFEAADTYERKNGVRYREIEVGLPNQLKLEQNMELIHKVIENVIGTDKVVTYAIHKKYSIVNESLGILTVNLHAHIMYSQRMVVDDPANVKPKELFFKKYNSKNPDAGGYRVDSRFLGPYRKRSNFLKDCRKYWADIVNEKLKENDINDSITHLSIVDQRILAEHNNDYQKLKELEGRFSTWLPLAEYKKLEAIIKDDTTIEEKILEVYDLDFHDMVEGKQPVQKEHGKYSDRFRQKMLCLNIFKKKLKELEKEKEGRRRAKEEQAEYNRTRYITEVLSDIGLKLMLVDENIKIKSKKIQKSPYMREDRLKSIASNIVTNGLYLKRVKVVDKIKEYKSIGKDVSNLLKEADLLNNEIQSLISPQNEERVNTLFTHFKRRKNHFAHLTQELKYEAKVIDNCLLSIIDLSQALKEESYFSNINILASQDELRYIENIVNISIDLDKKEIVRETSSETLGLDKSSKNSVLDDRKERLSSLINTIMFFVEKINKSLQQMIERRVRSAAMKKIEENYIRKRKREAEWELE